MPDFVVYQSATNTLASPQRLTWPSFVKWLRESLQIGPCTVEDCEGKKCQHKNGLAWSPVILRGKHRAAKHVAAITMLASDLDLKLDDAALAALIERIVELHLRCVLYSTHNSMPGRWALRGVFDLSRPILAAEYPAFYARIWSYLALPGANTTLKNLDRIWFVPSCPKGREDQAEFLDLPGNAIDVDAVLALSGPLPEAEKSAPAARVASDAPSASAALLEHVRGILAKHGPAVEGQGGDEHTCWIGHVFWDYQLSYSEYWPLALEWNETCEPPWEEHELDLKITNGAKYFHGDAQPTGRAAFELSKRIAAKAQSPSPVLWYDQVIQSPEYLTPQRCYPTHLAGVNQRIGGGLRGGTITLLCAPTGAGKSSFVVGLARHYATRLPVLLVNAELSAPEVAARVTAQREHVTILDVRDCRHITTGTDPNIAFLQMERSIADPIAEIQRIAAAIKTERGVDPIIIADYVQLIAQRVAGGSEVRHAINWIVDGLLDVAAHSDMPLVAVSSVSREYSGVNKSDALTDVTDATVYLNAGKESGGLELTAAVVLYLEKGTLVQNGVGKYNLTRIGIAKARFGAGAGEFVGVKFYGAEGRYEEDGRALVDFELEHDKAVEIKERKRADKGRDRLINYMRSMPSGTEFSLRELRGRGVRGLALQSTLAELVVSQAITVRGISRRGNTTQMYSVRSADHTEISR